MRQITLDMGLGRSASLDNFVAGPNVAVLSHLQLWVGHARSGASLRSPVPTYLWGATGSGKTHLLQAVYAALQAQGGTVGWLDASMAEAPPFDERWTAIVLDDVHLYNAVQQHAAFTWFVQAQTSQQGVLAAGARMMGTGLWKGGDQAVIDGVVINGSAGLVGRIAGWVRLVQTGHLYQYALVMLLGIFGFMTWRLWPGVIGPALASFMR